MQSETFLYEIIFEVIFQWNLKDLSSVERNKLKASINKSSSLEVNTDDIQPNTHRHKRPCVRVMFEVWLIVI